MALMYWLSLKAPLVRVVVFSSPERSSSERAAISFNVEKSSLVNAIPSVLLITVSLVISFFVTPAFSISCKACFNPFEAFKVITCIGDGTNSL